MRCSICCLWRNVEASCYKHFVVFSRNQHRRLLPAMCHSLRDGSRGLPATRVDNTWPIAALTSGSKAKYRLRIPTSAYRTCIRRSRRSIAMLFGTEKLEWCGYPTVKKFWWYVYSFWHNSRMWQTHTHTQTDSTWRHRLLLCTALCGNKTNSYKWNMK